MVLRLATFRLIGTINRPPVHKGQAVPAGALAWMDAEMRSSRWDLQELTVASVPVYPNVQRQRGSVGRSISGPGSCTKPYRRRANGKRRWSSKRNTANGRGVREPFHKQCDRLGYAGLGMWAKPKRICSTSRPRLRSTWNGWRIGWPGSNKRRRAGQRLRVSCDPFSLPHPKRGPLRDCGKILSNNR